MVSGDATQSPGCSQEHPDLKKKIIYNNLNFFICLPLKKIGTPSKFLCQTNFELKSIKKKKKEIVTENLRRKKIGDEKKGKKKKERDEGIKQSRCERENTKEEEEEKD